MHGANLFFKKFKFGDAMSFFGKPSSVILKGSKTVSVVNCKITPG